MTQALKELYTYNPVDRVLYETISLSHSQFSQTYNLVKSNTAMTFNSVAYQPSGFNITLPEKGGNQQDLGISLSNIDTSAILDLESALNAPEEAIQVIYRTFIDIDPNTIQYELILQLQDISVSQYTIDGRATNINLYDTTFPKRRFDSWVFTGLTI